MTKETIQVFLDIETNFPTNEEFAHKGQLAINNITHFESVTLFQGVQANHSGDSMDLAKYLKSADTSKYNYVFIGHNLIRFDLPVIRRILGCNLYDIGTVEDTLIISKVVRPNRKSHSLDSYFQEFGMVKPALSDSMDQMRERCRLDVVATIGAYNVLKHEMIASGTPEAVLKLEYEVARIIADQHEYGVNFDTLGAHLCISDLKDRLSILEDSVKISGATVRVSESKKDYPPKNQFKKDGTPSKYMLDYLHRNGLTISKLGIGPLFKWVVNETGDILPLDPLKPATTMKPLRLSSSAEVKEYLQEKGWVPTIWNETTEHGIKKRTSPKLFDDAKNMCPNLAKMAGDPVVDCIKDYLSYSNRLNILTGWMENTRVREDGRICADADTIGAVTGRFTHRIVANVPRSTSLYGKEMRSMFIPSKERPVMVGWDASSLEARMEAHYTHQYDGGAYANELLKGDIHEKNAKALGISRDLAKTFKYAVTYGAGVGKLATILNVPRSEAGDILQEFWRNNEGLARLNAAVQKEAQRGWITGLDGRRIVVDSAHSALNRLLQSAGAITMKYAMVLADRMITKEGLDARGLIRYHDEEQWEVRGTHAQRVGEIGVRSIELAGKYLKLRVPLTGEYKIGRNWSETH